MRLLTAFFSLLFILKFATFSGAQNRIDKYCLLINETANKPIEAKARIRLSIGIEKSLFDFKDSTIVMQLAEVDQRTTLIDAFNYLAQLGWEYVGLSATMNPSDPLRYESIGQQYLFKRTFDRSELK
ncbi:hypothetical protein [Spirosoma utsteinense]|uniref:DUF4177 domain-containing protein n=1 Tax=Spirosoma utsteinense TaxID=2585773 RepID=A0ABR6WCW5_9BACT|nr:hypothetical protein [Spirosoma utsteinense]MBC3788807.1 hypothetical protein [Spirosoma utsteinense]MBC3794401.1 hypothetical protein [Spirosoma utsteinense]